MADDAATANLAAQPAHAVCVPERAEEPGDVIDYPLPAPAAEDPAVGINGRPAGTAGGR